MDSAGRDNTADNGHGNTAEVGDKVHNRHHQAGQKLTFPGRFIEFAVGAVKFLRYRFLAVEHLDDVVARVDLLHLPIDVAEVFLLGSGSAFG